MAEFSREFRIDTIGGAPRGVTIDANGSERAALAARFRLEAIHALAAEAVLTRDGETVVAKGRVTASVVQSCVATSEPVPEDVAEDFAIEFRPHVRADSGEEEIELSEGELDVVFYDGAAVDLGEAVAETVSLALNPFPRSAKADEALREAGVKSEEEAKAEASPFAGLAVLKGKSEG
jgi:uncharacterized metal-binding protein YceD (DUF177 family)